MTELLPTSLPLDVTAPLIDDESFWKRSALERWANCQLSEHGSSWKRLYFERNLTDFLEDFDPLTYTEGDATAELTRVLGISKDYIFSLRLKQFLSHLDMEMLFQHVPTLCHLDMTYGVKQIGMEYERALFGMRLGDVSSLAKALRVTETLTILSLPCNLLDDNTVRILASGLHDNSTLTALDLSHKAFIALVVWQVHHDRQYEAQILDENFKKPKMRKAKAKKAAQMKPAAESRANEFDHANPLAA